MSAFCSWVAGTAAGCRCRVPLQGAAVRVLFALWSLVAGALQGAAAGCRCWCCCSGKLRQVLSRVQGFFSFSLLVFRSKRALVGMPLRLVLASFWSGCVSFCLCYGCRGAASSISSTSSKSSTSSTSSGKSNAQAVAPAAAPAANLLVLLALLALLVLLVLLVLLLAQLVQLVLLLLLWFRGVLVLLVAASAASAAAGSDRRRFATLRQKCIMTARALFCWFSQVISKERVHVDCVRAMFPWFQPLSMTRNESLQKTSKNNARDVTSAAWCELSRQLVWSCRGLEASGDAPNSA